MRRIHSSGRRRFAGTDTTALMLAERLAAVEQLVVAQQERIAQQEQELAGLRASMGETTGGEAPAGQALILPATARASRKMDAGLRSSRRTLLKYGGAAAAAGVAASALALSGGQSAQAQGRAAMRPFTSVNWTTSSFTADAETVVAPSSGGYTANDILQVKYGTSTVYNALSTLKAAIAGYDTTGSNVGLYGTSSAGYGLFGVTDTGNGATGGGLNGTASSTGTGVVGLSQSGVGVSGTSTNGIGGTFHGGLAPLALGLQGPPGQPTSGNHSMGEIYADGNGDLWVCYGAGTPGTWKRLAHLAAPVIENTNLTDLSGGAITYITKQIRLLDTRGNDSLAQNDNGGNPIAYGSPYTVPVAGVNWQQVQVPSDAVGAVGNVTVVADKGTGGFVAVVPQGAGFTGTANLAYSPGQIVSNYFNTALNGGALDIYIGSGSADVVLDLFAVIA